MHRQFGVIEKVLLGFVGLVDTAIAAVALSDLLQESATDGDKLAAATVGTIAAADALGLLAIILLMPEIDTEYETREPGIFRPVETFPCPCGPGDTLGACPSGHTGRPPA